MDCVRCEWRGGYVYQQDERDRDMDVLVNCRDQLLRGWGQLRSILIFMHLSVPAYSFCITDGGG